MPVYILMTCHNRKEKTLECIRTLYDKRLNMRFVVVDDGSTDGTGQAIEEFARSEGLKIRILQGNGNLYWAGGMRKAMDYVLRQDIGKAYVVLVNDDVRFFPGAIEKMMLRSKEKGDAAVAGAVQSTRGDLSYGGVQYDRKRVSPKFLGIADADSYPCDTANCNCLLLPYFIFNDCGSFDRHFVHSMADYDYGFKINRLGYRIWSTDFFVGICDDNPVKNTWRDASLNRLERIKLKESPKGLPFLEWFYFINKNFGLVQALWHSITPYLKIFIGK